MGALGRTSLLKTHFKSLPLLQQNNSAVYQAEMNEVRRHASGETVALNCQGRKKRSFRSPEKGRLLLVPMEDASRSFGFAYLEHWTSLEYLGGEFAGSGRTMGFAT